MKKTMGFPSVFCISAGAMISSGLFVLPGLAFAKAGPGVFISYLLAGLVALTTVLSLSELITAMPKAGGDYFYVSRTFGQLYGTVSGILSWLALSFKSAFAVFGIAELVYLLFGFELRISALVLATIFTVINLTGVKEAAKFQVLLVVSLIAILVFFFVAGIQDVVIQRFRPFLTEGGVNSIFSTAGFVFVSFGGVLTTASIAGEIRNPARNIPAGLIGSTVAVTFLYTLVTFMVVGVVPPEDLAGSLAPVALAGRASGGMILYSAIMIASLLAFVSTANGGILTASRYPIALSKDNMLPPIFSRLFGSKQTPYVAIAATGLLIGLSVILDFEILIKAASTVILLSNIFAHLSVIVMRESGIKNYLPTYNAPFYPWLQIGGIIAFMLLIVDMGVQPILFSLLFMAAGVLLYFMRRKKTNQFSSSAMLHLLQRITNKALLTDDLQNELRDIVADRDNLSRDEFDHAIAAASLVEIDGSPPLNEAWRRVANVIEKNFEGGIGADEIVNLIEERESQSSTAISDFVAIPHIIIDTDDVFQVVLVRAKDGLCFDAAHRNIKAVFILIGSRNMRNLHLHSLAAIAQVAQDSDFENDWMAASNFSEIRDIFLLSSRKRFNPL